MRKRYRAWKAPVESSQGCLRVSSSAALRGARRVMIAVKMALTVMTAAVRYPSRAGLSQRLKRVMKRRGQQPRRTPFCDAQTVPIRRNSGEPIAHFIDGRRDILGGMENNAYRALLRRSPKI
jgi:hypothetical protein